MVKTKTTKSPGKKTLRSPMGASTPMTGRITKHQARMSSSGNTRSSGRESSDDDAPKRRRKRHSGTQALREIRFYQRSTHFLIPKLPFCRLVKEIMQYSSERRQYRIQSLALEALQEASESFIIRYLEDANLCAIHSKRVTILAKDMDLVGRLKYEGKR